MKTHWKKAFNLNYLGAYSLEPGKDLTVTIKAIEKENVKNSDGREEEVVVAHLENQKPFILNKTNARAISYVLRSNYIEDWIGKSIQLYVAQVSAFGSTVEALRVRDFQPKGKEKLSGDRFTKMVQAIEEGKFEKIKAYERFDLTLNQKKQIEAI